MEYGVGSLVTPSHMAINLKLLGDMDQYKELDGDHEFRWFINNNEYKSIGKSCAGERPLAMTPFKFDEKMDEKVTKGGASGEQARHARPRVPPATPAPVCRARPPVAAV